MQRVGAYEVLYELRSGGMGSVLLGRRRGPGSFEKLVAIKTIRADLAGAQQVRAMFLDEAAILARLGHPAVATVHDFGEEGGSLYLVMEYVPGESLHAVIERRPPPPIAARLVAEAARGLHAAHELRDLSGALLGVVHRDISPDNVLLGFDGHVKVIDFGIALIKNRQAPVTELGMLKGKPPYMSPEQIKNEAIDRRSDVFALGAVLWELLAGERLFQGESIYAIARAIEHQVIAPPSRHAGALPRGLDEVVLAALAREPAARIPTAAALAERLEEVVHAVGGETVEAWTRRELRAQREAHQRWLAGVLGGAAAPAPMGRATGAVTAMAPGPRAAASSEPARAGEGAAPGPPGPAGQLARAGLPELGPGEPQAAALWATAPATPPAPAVGPGARDLRPTVPMPASQGEPAPASQGEPRPASVLAAVPDPELARVVEPAGSRAASTRPAPVTSQLELRRPSRRSFALVLVVALLAAGALSYLVLSRARDGAALPADAGLDASGADLGAPRSDAHAADPVDAGALPSDAMGDATVTAPLPRDAGADRGDHVDARVRRSSRDAGASTPPPPRDPARDPPLDARAAPPSAGPPGKLRVTAEPYANVVIDDEPAGATPILGRSLPAGRHVVLLLDPVTGAVRLRRTVDVPAGGVVRIELP